MIDTHAHLADRFAADVEGIIERAKLAGVEKIILSASSLEDTRSNLEIAKGREMLYPAVGIHPQEANEDIDKQLGKLSEIIEKNQDQIIAIGECGLEFVDPYDQKAQEMLFMAQIELAKKHDKPIIVHSREASDRLLEILGEYSGVRGVIHCYTGGKKRIKKFMELPGEWYFGIDGNLTYETGLVEVVKLIPKDSLLLETDTPYLAPIPHRGEINEPANIRHIYVKIAEVWNTTLTEAEKVIDSNAKRLFKLKLQKN